MIIKKFQGNTETEAIMLAKEELGKDAIVMNIKTVSPRGIYKLFKKPTVEITAAVDEGMIANDKNRERVKPAYKKIPNIIEEDTAAEVSPVIKQDEEPINAQPNIDKKLSSIRSMYEQKMTTDKAVKDNDDKLQADNKTIDCVQLIYNQLVGNEVDEKYANQIISEIEHTFTNETTIDNILSNMYQKIVLKLGQTKSLEVTEGKTRYIFFIGPTGVGKTTTIAKIASSLIVGKKYKIGLLTADTYRIAAVEQLKTYANILGAPLKVIYSPDEMQDAMKEFDGYDLVLIDTAGRSHKSREQRDDIERLICTVPEELRETYLVLSVTTKYRDLIKITETYSEISDYRLIFTKLDETGCIGNILNIKLLTGAQLSYATFGQNVPNDISIINPQTIAKQLLGGNE